MTKKKRLKKFNIKKKRQRLIKLKREMEEEKEKQEKDKRKTELEIRLEKETKLYWVRAVTGILFALLGRGLFQFVGWFLLIWMLAFWFGFPFITSFLIYRYEYDKEKWNWKNIIKPGIGIYFLFFMITGTILHTFLKFL